LLKFQPVPTSQKKENQAALDAQGKPWAETSESCNIFKENFIKSLSSDSIIILEINLFG